MKPTGPAWNLTILFTMSIKISKYPYLIVEQSFRVPIAACLGSPGVRSDWNLTASKTSEERAYQGHQLIPTKYSKTIKSCTGILEYRRKILVKALTLTRLAQIWFYSAFTTRRISRSILVRHVYIGRNYEIYIGVAGNIFPNFKKRNNRRFYA